MAIRNENTFLDQVSASIQRAQAEIHRAPQYHLIFAVGAVLGFGKFVEAFLGFRWFSEPMRDINGELTLVNWIIAASLALSLVIALTFAIHLLLRGISKRLSARLGIAMGIFALIAVAANPWIISDQLAIVSGSSFDALDAQDGPSLIVWLAEIARNPAYVIAALAAGFGVELMIIGVQGLRDIRVAKVDVTTGTSVLVRYEEKKAEAKMLPYQIDDSRAKLRRSVAIATADFAQSQANTIGAFLNGTSISAEVIDDLIKRVVEPQEGFADEDVIDIVNMVAPAPLNYEELPDARTLSEAARDELSDYAAYLRENYNVKIIMKELEAA